MADRGVIRAGLRLHRASSGLGRQKHERELFGAFNPRRNRGFAALAVQKDHGDRFQYPSQSEAIPVAPVKVSDRKGRQPKNIKSAKPFSEFLTDNFNRQHDYLRISITERCNLRCLYCMPEEGVPLSPQSHLLTSPEIFYLSSLFVSQGVTKIRLTGGEPTIRRDILPLMHSIGSLRSKGLRELCLTTNGISLHRKLDSMVEAGLTGVNLSLDTLDPFQFQIMTRRKGFEAVMKSIDRILEMNKFGAGIKLKINCVVMRGINEREIVPFVEMGREKDVEVRFIEYMPFDGNKWSKGKMLGYQEMLEIIREKYPELRKVQDRKNDTSKTYEVPGFVGRVGFITSMTHNFCGSCNRLRITGDGNLKVCLFGNAEVSLRDLLRKENGGNPIDQEAFEVIKTIELERQKNAIESQTALGFNKTERELLDVIGVAVKRKKEKHAGIGQLENMKNRPMILIGGGNSYRAVHSTRASKSSIATSWLKGLSSSSLMSTTPAYVHISRYHAIRIFSTTRMLPSRNETLKPPTHLPHLTNTGAAHMIPIHEKAITHRLARASGTIIFQTPAPLPLIHDSALKKGDVLALARIAGIMAAKKTSELIPLCHPISLSAVEIELELFGDVKDFKEQKFGGVEINVKVECDGKTGVEMEALTAVMGAALTVVDMVKSVDRGVRIENVRVVEKAGGKSGRWREGILVQ